MGKPFVLYYPPCPTRSFDFVAHDVIQRMQDPKPLLRVTQMHLFGDPKPALYVSVLSMAQYDIYWENKQSAMAKAVTRIIRDGTVCVLLPSGWSLQDYHTLSKEILCVRVLEDATGTLETVDIRNHPGIYMLQETSSLPSSSSVRWWCCS